MADELEPPELGALRDNSVVWRVTLWAAAATVAVAAAVLVTQSDIGANHLLQAFVQPTAEKQVASNDDLVKRMEAQRAEETRRLEARIRELAADRDRLNARVASLEQNFTDLTGSIKRDLAIVAATVPANGAAPAATKPAPATAPVLTTPPSTTPPKEPAPTASKAEAQTVPAEDKPPAPAEAAARPEAPAQTEAAPAPPPQIVAVPMPPVRVAALGQGGQEPEGKPALAVEIGGARSMDILNARWVAVKANFGPLIEGLSPLVRYDSRPGIIPYRLIVGPLPNGAAAAQLCARFHASKVPCRTTEFTGDKFVQQ